MHLVKARNEIGDKNMTRKREMNIKCRRENKLFKIAKRRVCVFVFLYVRSDLTHGQ